MAEEQDAAQTKARDQRLEVRTSRKMVLLGTLAGWLLRMYAVCLRMEAVDRCGLTRRGDDKLDFPIIWCAWHNRVLGLAIACKRIFPHRDGVALTSASHDGAALAAAVKVIGVEAIRGSSSRRGSAALKQLVRAVRGGQDVGVTPDGPRGPRYELSPGLVKLAQVTQAPVMGFHIHYSRAIRLKTWDRFVIPLPFSKLTITFDELISVPRALDDAALEEKRKEIEEMMRAGVDDLDLPRYEHSERKRNRR